MKQIKQMRIIIYLSLAFSLLFTSCVPEKRLARQFQQNPPEAKFLVITPDIVLKQSIKPLKDSLVDQYSQRQKDSVAFYESDFVQYIPDSLFFQLYLPAFQKQMEELELDVVYNQPPGDFFSADSAEQAYIFNMAQLQLEEFTQQEFAKETFGSQLYFQEHLLDGVSLSLWIEFQRVNSDGQKPMVLFSELSESDQVDGHFSQHQLTGDVQYSYKIDELDLAQVKQFIRRAGKVHASYLYDFLMNQYINAMLKQKEIKKKYYLHYNLDKDQLEYVTDGRFYLQEP